MLAVLFGLSETTLIPMIVTVLSSGFLLGLMRVMPERKSILVAASETAVKTVNDALETIRAELIESQLKVAKLEGANLAALVERDRLLAEVATLRAQLKVVEQKLDEMTRTAIESAQGMRGAPGAPGAPGQQGRQGEPGSPGPRGDSS